MRTIEIRYDPYKMKTKMNIDGADVVKDNVCKDDQDNKLKTFIKNKTPLQTWIEPIQYLGWGGLVNCISDSDTNDEVKVIFSGRDIDFEDLKRSVADQNEEREKHNKNTRVIYHFEHNERMDDKKISQNIEEVYNELRSDRFRELVESRTTSGLRDKYEALEENYKIAKESEFRIVFAGTYSSGKSTLLNALIRHNILPTSHSTCTSKNCRIRHDGSLKQKVSLTCLGENSEIVVKKRIFENDADCAAAFLEICPNNAENKHPEVDTMELGVDLSHLYPDSVSKDKFTIVLIDTPGMNSGSTEKNGINEHAEIALEAVSDKNKPMVVLCVDDGYQDVSIGRFMGQIITQSQKDSGFNDRFLFLINKSDDFTYGNGLTPDTVRKEFAEYLMDPTKMNITEDKKEFAESASHFVPRIFMTAALVEFAIQQKAYNFTVDELADDIKYAYSKAYKDFQEKIITLKKTNFYLSRYCDIPNYLKDEIEEEFETAIESGDTVRAVQLQCGIVSVESAIRDYIERYAYPIKVRGLIDTFEDILEDVKGFTGATLSELKKAEAELGEKESEKNEVSGRKKGIEEKIAALEKAREKINAQMKTLDNIQFDSKSLNDAIGEFRAHIERDEDIIFIRKSNGKKVLTGQRSPSEVEEDINTLVNNIKVLFDDVLQKTNKKLEEIKDVHDHQIFKIFNFLKTTVLELENAGVFKQGEYEFKDSVSWKMYFENINFDSFISDIKQTVVNRSIKLKEVPNTQKIEYRSSSNPFKIIRSWFMPDYSIVSEATDGYYYTDSICKSIDDYINNFEEEIINMETIFNGIIEDGRNQSCDLIGKLLYDLDEFLRNIQEQEERIKQLSVSIFKLNEQVQKYEATCRWLHTLKDMLKGE